LRRPSRSNQIALSRERPRYPSDHRSEGPLEGEPNAGPLDLQNLTRDKFQWLRRVCTDPLVGHVACRLATLLVDYVDHRSGMAWPSQSTLAEAAGVTPRCVQNGLKNLELTRHLKITVQRGRTNTNRYTPMLKYPNLGSDISTENTNLGTEKHEPPFAQLLELIPTPLPLTDRGSAMEGDISQNPTPEQRAQGRRALLDVASALGGNQQFSNLWVAR
jgi:hypothetical protein